MAEELVALLGDVSGKRVLELGFDASSSAIELASRGARVVAVDTSAARVDFVRRLLVEEEVKVELHQGDLAELAFLRADTVDAAVSDRALGNVPDIDRVFRQVHRVLRPDGLFVFSLPHPAVAGDYFAGPTIGALHAALSRVNFRVDSIHEPSPTLILRSRKQ